MALFLSHVIKLHQCNYWVNCRDWLLTWNLNPRYGISVRCGQMCTTDHFKVLQISWNISIRISYETCLERQYTPTNTGPQFCLSFWLLEILYCRVFPWEPHPWWLLLYRTPGYELVGRRRGHMQTFWENTCESRQQSWRNRNWRETQWVPSHKWKEKISSSFCTDKCYFELTIIFHKLAKQRLSGFD